MKGVWSDLHAFFIFGIFAAGFAGFGQDAICLQNGIGLQVSTVLQGGNPRRGNVYGGASSLSFPRRRESRATECLR
jgi:hypothetical protein